MIIIYKAQIAIYIAIIADFFIVSSPLLIQDIPVWRGSNTEVCGFRRKYVWYLLRTCIMDLVIVFTEQVLLRQPGFSQLDIFSVRLKSDAMPSQVFRSQ